MQEKLQKPLDSWKDYKIRIINTWWSIMTIIISLCLMNVYIQSLNWV